MTGNKDFWFNCHHSQANKKSKSIHLGPRENKDKVRCYDKKPAKLPSLPATIRNVKDIEVAPELFPDFTSWGNVRSSEKLRETNLKVIYYEDTDECYLETTEWDIIIVQSESLHKAHHSPLRMSVVILDEVNAILRKTWSSEVVEITGNVKEVQHIGFEYLRTGRRACFAVTSCRKTRAIAELVDPQVVTEHVTKIIKPDGPAVKVHAYYGNMDDEI
ncbi:hypothetical protein C1645_812147 [Glomus cerebriforme]|uniref:Replication origin-binding protein domain-containing protein n=1 Tax=Glomus cerebriforme TaxID=658196 RepID=A0A397TNF7_9GLOM|nr:hypothetical protein C1645_812147 [Glomus cerebriforme]